MILEGKKLVKEYTRGNEIFKAVDNVNLSVCRGDFISIIGRSGSGKSTLFHLLTGLCKASEGDILVDNINISNLSEDEMSSLRNEKIGYITQGQNLLSNFTIMDNICMPYYLSDKNENVYDRALSLLKKVGLENMENEYPSSLSGGELRRVSIIRALINDPDIIIADEPTSNLDLDNSRIVMELLKSISKENKAVLISTHDLEFLDYTNKTYYMEKGVLKEK